MILNYHRICANNNMPKHKDELVVSEKKFENQLIFLKKNYDLVSLDNFLNFEKNNAHKICITFDDGYKDNLTHALPILVKLNIPATIYVATKFFENEFDLWWYELQDYIWSDSKNIKFSYDGKNYDILSKNENEKSKCFMQLRGIIKKLDRENQKKFMNIVTNKIERKEYKDIILTKEDLKSLSLNSLITIGAHSHNHLSLKNLTEEDCLKEIKKSKEILENLTNNKINHFSYPYGTEDDVGEREFNIVKKLGFKSAVTTSVGKPTKNKLYNLPRIHINQNTSEKILKFKLSSYYPFYRKIRELINF